MDHGKELLAELRKDELSDEEDTEAEDDAVGGIEESGGLAVARKPTLMSEMNPNMLRTRGCGGGLRIRWSRPIPNK